jgi:hypothetical protein
MAESMCGLRSDAPGGLFARFDSLYFYETMAVYFPVECNIARIILPLGNDILDTETISKLFSYNFELTRNNRVRTRHHGPPFPLALSDPTSNRLLIPNRIGAGSALRETQIR